MLRTILTTGRGRNTVIELNVDGKGSFPVMVKDYSVHPVSRNLLHADFIHVDTTKPLVVEVPFHTTGKSVGVAQGGTLLTTVRSLKVKCIPAKIPDFVEHDVSALDINDVLKVSELSVPEGVEVLMEADRKVAMVAPPRVEAEPTAEEGEEGAEGEEGEEGADGATTEGAKGDDAKPDGGGDKRS